MGDSPYTYLLTDCSVAISWYLALSVIGLLVWPLTFLVFRRWPDRGVLLSRPVGLLVLGHLTWFLSGTVGMPFSRGGILCVAAVVGALSVWVGLPRRARLLRELASAKRFLIGAELLTILAFVYMVQVRRYDPDVFGTEKYMDLALYAGLLRETVIPPGDTWFSGGSINYHYGGYLLHSTIGKLLGLSPGYAYNLSLATVFAMAVSVSLAVGSMLGGRLRWGVLTAFTTCLIGNLTGVVKMLTQGQGGYVGDLYTLRYRYCWQASRVIHDGSPNNATINEFPFFSFVWGDLHPHVTAFAWGLLFLAVTYGVLHSPVWRRPWRSASTPWRLLAPQVVLAALCAAMLPVNNLFDLPTFASVFWVVLLVAAYAYSKRLGRGGAGMSRPIAAMLCFSAVPVCAKFPSLFFGPGATPKGLSIFAAAAALGMLACGVWFLFSTASNGRWRVVATVALGGLVLVAGMILGLPFWLHYAPPARSIGLVGWAPHRSGLGEYLTVFGFHLVALVYALGILGLNRKRLSIRPEVIGFFGVVGLLLLSVAGGLAGTPIVPILLLLLTGALLLLVRETERPRPDTRMQFGLVLALAGLALMLGCEYFYLVDNYGVKRMNTLFKFHYQAWLLLGIALPVLLRSALESTRKVPAHAFALVPVGLLFLGCLAVPFSYTMTLFDRRTIEVPTPGGVRVRAPNLDGQQYLTTQHPDDWHVIDAVRKQILGRPVVLEAPGGAYRYESVLSTNTGVRTVLGWENHENVWRGGEMGEEIRARKAAIETIYTSDRLETVRELFARYAIEYVFVGSVERGLYKPNQLKKFESLETVCRSPQKGRQSTLYRVPAAWLTP